MKHFKLASFATSVTLLALLPLTAAAAINLSCRSDSMAAVKWTEGESLITVPRLEFERQPLADHSLFVDYQFAICKDRQNNIYGAQYVGGGASLRLSKSKFRIFCPLVSKNRVTPPDVDYSRGSLQSSTSPINDQEVSDRANFMGVRVGLDIVGGATVGVFTNHMLGACFVVGVDAGIGATASMGMLSIVRYKDQEAAREFAKPFFKKLREAVQE